MLIDPRSQIFTLVDLNAPTLYRKHVYYSCRQRLKEIEGTQLWVRLFAFALGPLSLSREGIHNILAMLPYPPCPLLPRYHPYTSKRGPQNPNPTKDISLESMKLLILLMDFTKFGKNILKLEMSTKRSMNAFLT